MNRLYGYGCFHASPLLCNVCVASHFFGQCCCQLLACKVDDVLQWYELEDRCLLATSQCQPLDDRNVDAIKLSSGCD
jgi:hypothetical protein